MNSFFTATGSSPPPECHDDTGAHDPRPEDPEPTCSLPEELIEALAGLLAEALVQDIRQYPTRPDPPAKTDTTSRAESVRGPPSNACAKLA
jgi:hypothetical protein